MLDQQDTATTEQIAVVDAPPVEASPEPAVEVAPAVGGRHREERLITDPDAYRCTDVAGPARRRRRRGVGAVVASATSWLTEPVTM